MGRLTDCLAQQPSAHLEQQTAAESQDWDSLEHAHAELAMLADSVMHSYKWTQARVTWGIVLHVSGCYVIEANCSGVDRVDDCCVFCSRIVMVQ